MTSHHSPFKRAKQMLALIAHAMSLPLDAQMVAMAGIGEYRSRGKGEGGRFLGSSARCVAMDKREARKARNRRKEKRRG